MTDALGVAGLAVLMGGRVALALDGVQLAGQRLDVVARRAEPALEPARLRVGGHEGTTLKAGRSITLTVAKKAPPKPKQWVSVFSTSGSGQERTDEFRIPSGLKARVRYTFGGEFNDTLFLKTPDQGSDDFGDLLVNDIGAHSGVSRLYGKSGAYYLEVNGDSWTIDVQVFKRPE